ncbi:MULTISPECIES: hypothetical protein [Micromonospora]|uniref:Uncharacterized protein n=1 Tax=Micromonospora sp. HUAS YX12 TaxID=3156396 RepID=A0AAU7QXR7_9ACTN
MTAYDIAAKLPGIDLLRQRCRALAVLERLLDEGHPYYAYDPAWGADEAALMSNGGGDEWAVVFAPEGAFIRVFDHESSMSPYADDDLELWPGLLDGLPAQFHRLVEEPAFGDEGRFVATAVLWRLAGDDRWHAGQGIDFPPSRGPYDDTGPDGSPMLEILCDDVVDEFVEFAGEYHEVALDRDAVAAVVAHRPLTEALVRAVNPEASLSAVRADVENMGYPVA